MKRSRIFILKALVFLMSGWLLWSGIAAGQTFIPRNLGISEAIEISMTNNPAVTVASSRIEASDTAVSQAKSGFYPQVSVSAGYTRTTSPLWAFGTKLNQGQITAQDFDPNALNDPDAIDNYGITLSSVWSLYDSGQTYYAVRQAKLGQSYAGHTLDRTTQEVIAGTISAYNAVLLSQQHLETIHLAIKTAEASLSTIQSRFESGFIVKSDLLQTRVHIANLNQQRLQAESQVAISRAALCAAMGVNADTGFELPGFLGNNSEITGSLEHWLETASNQRPDLRAICNQLEIAEAEVQKSRASRLPSLALSAEYGTNSDTPGDAHDNYTIGAVVSMNLFSGFRVSSKIAEAASNLKQVRAMKSGLELNISMETRSAYYQTQSTWEQIRVAESAVSQAEEAFRIVKDRYDTDLVTIVELLNSELALQQARSNRLLAIHDYNNAKAGLMLAAGILDADFQ